MGGEIGQARRVGMDGRGVGMGGWVELMMNGTNWAVGRTVQSEEDGREAVMCEGSPGWLLSVKLHAHRGHMCFCLAVVVVVVVVFLLDTYTPLKCYT